MFNIEYRHNVIMPDFITIHLRGGPSFATLTASTVSGREVRYYERQTAIHKYTLNGCRLSNSQFQIFNSFFRARLGSAFAFRIKDHADYKIDNQICGIGDGQKQNFELYKIYPDMGQICHRRIFALNSDNLISSHEIKTIDQVEGIISLKDPLPKDENLIITGDFEIWVRFVSDEFRYSTMEDGSILIDDISLIEVI